MISISLQVPQRLIGHLGGDWEVLFTSEPATEQTKSRVKNLVSDHFLRLIDRNKRSALVLVWHLSSFIST